MDDKKQKANEAFARRLGDWSEPGAIRIIRNGVDITDLTPEEIRRVELGVPVASIPTVVNIDEDGNIHMSDGTVRVP